MMAALKQQLESNAKFLAVLEQIRQELQQSILIVRLDVPVDINYDIN